MFIKLLVYSRHSNDDYEYYLLWYHCHQGLSLNIVGIQYMCCDVQSYVSITRTLTLNTSTTRCSLTAKTAISKIVMVSIWIGLVFPRTAPKEIRTAAVLKSAFIMLRKEERRHWRIMHTPHIWVVMNYSITLSRVQGPSPHLSPSGASPRPTFILSHVLAHPRLQLPYNL